MDRTAQSHLAAIRFGLGVRAGERPPADARGWLLAQLDGGERPTGPSAADGLRAKDADLRARAANGGELTGTSEVATLVRAETTAWAARRLASPRPFLDRLTDFWMNVLTVSRRAGGVNPVVGAYEREAIRPHVAGRFADMLRAAVRHPAMLLYLDNGASVGPNSPAGRRAGRGLNENLARELLELHSVTPAAGYGQADVRALAMLLTGWGVSQRREPFGFVFRALAHEPGSKTLLGRTFPEGARGGEEAIAFLGTHPATYRHLATRLARHFVADAPPPRAVAALERELARTGGDLGAAARLIVAMPDAWDPPLTRVRSPLDYAVAACRALGVPPERGDVLLNGLAALGQPLWSAPQPEGWSDLGPDWTGPEAVMRRIDWAYSLAGRFGRAGAEEVAAAALGPLLREATRDALAAAGPRDALTLLLASPEFMRR